MHAFRFFALMSLALVGFVTSAQAEDIPFDEGRIFARITWIDGPVVGLQESKLRLDWLNEQKQPIEMTRRFNVRPFMPHHNHGSRPVVISPMTIDASGAPLVGSYEVSRVRFSMTGYWELRVELEVSPGRVEEMRSPVEFSRR